VKIKKGQKLLVKDSRKGTFFGKASKAFDTDKDEWYSVVVDQDEPVYDLSKVWKKGEEIPCRKGLARVFGREDA
jgi:hypothetical protein